MIAGIAALGRFVEFGIETLRGFGAVRAWTRWDRLGRQLFFIGTMSVPVLAITGAFIGMVGPWAAETWPEPELAWFLTPDKEGKGFGGEAALAARDYIYEVLKWESLASAIEPSNAASIKLAERMGAKAEYEHPLPNGGVVIYYRHPAPEAAP